MTNCEEMISTAATIIQIYHEALIFVKSCSTAGLLCVGYKRKQAGSCHLPQTHQRRSRQISRILWHRLWLRLSSTVSSKRLMLWWALILIALGGFFSLKQIWHLVNEISSCWSGRTKLLSNALNKMLFSNIPKGAVFLKGATLKRPNASEEQVN